MQARCRDGGGKGKGTRDKGRVNDQASKVATSKKSGGKRGGVGAEAVSEYNVLRVI